jgi:hypothetical protein
VEYSKIYEDVKQIRNEDVGDEKIRLRRGRIEREGNEIKPKISYFVSKKFFCCSQTGS